MRIELKVIFKWLIIIMLLLVFFLIGATIWYINESISADEKAEQFAEQFYEDLLAENYDGILTYTYVPEGEELSAEAIKHLLLSYEDMALVLQNPDSLEIGEFGDTERRCIEVKGYDIEDNYIYFLIDVKIVDGVMFLDFSEQLKE